MAGLQTAAVGCLLILGLFGYATAEKVTFFVSPDTHFTQSGGVRTSLAHQHIRSLSCLREHWFSACPCGAPS